MSKLDNKRIQSVMDTHKTDEVLVVGDELFLPKNRTFARDYASKNKLTVVSVKRSELKEEVDTPPVSKTPSKK